MKRLFQALVVSFRFLTFYWHAQTIYRIHSPFVVRFLREVVEDRRQFYIFPLVEEIRKSMIKRQDSIRIPSLGAPSKTLFGSTRPLGRIVQQTAVSARGGRRLFKIIHTYKPEIMIELGTAAGLSTIYQAPAALAGELYTIEGAPDLARIAHQQFARLGLPNVQLIIGAFAEVLPGLLEELPRIDYAFLDGHHEGKARQAYVEALLSRMHEGSVLVFSDIYWSRDMMQAWKQLKAHPRVRLSIDLFEFGVLFFDTNLYGKPDLKLVPARWKPWQLGIWR